MNLPLARIIRPIVEGQVRTWLAAHPEGESYPGHMVTGIGKRVTHDICADQTVERIKLALATGSGSVPVGQGEPSPSGGFCPAATQPALEFATGDGGRSEIAPERQAAGGDVMASPAAEELMADQFWQ